MEINKLIEALKTMLPQKVPYGQLVCADAPYGNSGPFVYEDPEPYFIEAAIKTIETQQQRIAELEAELKDERHRHDRYVDFELAEAEELRKLKAERDDLLMIIRFHTDCEFCKHEHVLACEEPCSSCRGTGGKEDKWEWLRPEGHHGN